MKIAIFGTGGVGGYFGGLLAHAGHEVTFIARGEKLRALQSDGLRVKSVNGDFVIHPARATDDPQEVGPVEYVIVATKHYHLEQAAPAIRPLVGRGTTVVPLLNGVDAHEYLSRAVGDEHVVGGFCSLVSMVESPGVIRQESKLRRVVVGELDRSQSDRVGRLIEAWAAVGVQAEQPEDIFVEMWIKFIFISSIGGVSSLARTNMGEMLGTPETRQLFIQAMTEVDVVARAKGIDLPQDAVAGRLAMAEGMESTTTTSMQRDVAAGKPFELEAFSGTIVRLGREASVPTPVHGTMYALLKPALLAAMG